MTDQASSISNPSSASFADSGPLAVKLLKNGTLKAYKDLPHGMPTTHAEIIGADLLAFFKA